MQGRGQKKSCLLSPLLLLFLLSLIPLPSSSKGLEIETPNEKDAFDVTPIKVIATFEGAISTVPAI